MTETPQLENGYTKIANEIIDALSKYRIPGEQMQCLLVILRKTYGYNKLCDRISNTQFVVGTGLKKQNVNRALKELIKKNIVIKNDDNYITSYGFNKKYKTWVSNQKRLPVIKSDSEIGKSVIKSDAHKRHNIQKTRGEFKFSKNVPIPDNIFLTENMINYIHEQGGKNGDGIQLMEDFKNYHGAKGSKFVDWNKAFQTWVRNDKKFHPEKYTINEFVGEPG